MFRSRRTKRIKGFLSPRDGPQTEQTIIGKWIAGAARRGGTDGYLGKRRRPRTKFTQTIKVEMADDDSGEPLFLKCYDISHSGIGFVSRNPIQQHTRLRLSAQTPDEVVHATVTRCTKTFNGYQIGATFDG